MPEIFWGSPPPYGSTDYKVLQQQQWVEAPKALPVPGQAIYLDADSSFQLDFDDYLADAIEGSRDLAADLPYLCELRRPPAPDLAELIQNALEDEWCNEDGDFTIELPDVSDLQAEFDKRFEDTTKDNAMGMWFKSDVALDITSPEFAQRLQAVRDRMAEQGLS